MIKELLAFFGINTEGGEAESGTRRKYSRHAAFNAEVIIGDSIYIAHDWSMGGVAFDNGEENVNINVGDKVRVVLNFHFPDNVITIGQSAHVVRSVGGITAVEFDPLPNAARSDFNKVLENLYTQSFIESQIAG